MPDPTKEAPILVGDLTLIRDTLNAVHNVLQAEDLASQYRKLDTRVRRSPLTNAVADALLKLEGYIESAEEPEDE
ncbi:hypothetical protein [Candidatus Solirubrobacter pratensis]|uniref:hypothetical protein n=1 Tax=Candidatus Solirubrobacter pratensis TaxID=1298857 RepID=UPI00041E6808|nr:hypothetical protein [Candidatus Solirubrobacter pratensis]